MLAVEYDNTLKELVEKRRGFMTQATDSINDLGKFEGYSDVTDLAVALYFYDCALNGCDDGCFSDGNGGESTTIFTISDYDRVLWPRLDDGSTTVYMEESNSGFISISWGDDSAIAELEREYSDEGDEGDEGDN